MRRHLPTVLSGLALFISLGGTSLAAISYATNAGAVDGKSAVGSSASLKSATGRLVATGSDGRVLGKFVKGVSHANGFGSYVPVVDNATGASTALSGYAKIGTLNATCSDENTAAGIADPRTDLTFTNTSGQITNYSSRLGTNGGTVTALQPSTTASLAVRGSNTFSIEAQIGTSDIRFDGTVRQDGKGTAAARCLVYGTLTLVN